MAFKKALIERASGKTVLTEDGPLRIVPRDREGLLTGLDP